MNTAIWGWYPPLYEQYESGIFNILVNPVLFEETITRKNEETGEEKTETITRYTVWYEELDLPNLRYALHNNDLITANKLILNEIVRIYDTSPAVNEFTIGGIPVWLDKDTRSGLKLRFEAELAMGNTDTVLWYNGMQFPLKLEQAIQMLYIIEIYASACYDCTLKHLATINSMNDAEAIAQYNYKEGYPDKLNF